MAPHGRKAVAWDPSPVQILSLNLSKLPRTFLCSLEIERTILVRISFLKSMASHVAEIVLVCEPNESVRIVFLAHAYKFLYLARNYFCPVTHQNGAHANDAFQRRVPHLAPHSGAILSLIRTVRLYFTGLTFRWSLIPCTLISIILTG